jgi:hypothetical protein
VKIRPVDLYWSTGCRQAGIVLVGDALQARRPAPVQPSGPRPARRAPAGARASPRRHPSARLPAQRLGCSTGSRDVQCALMSDPKGQYSKKVEDPAKAITGLPPCLKLRLNRGVC